MTPYGANLGAANRREAEGSRGGGGAKVTEEGVQGRDDETRAGGRNSANLRAAPAVTEVRGSKQKPQSSETPEVDVRIRPLENL